MAKWVKVSYVVISILMILFAAGLTIGLTIDGFYGSKIGGILVVFCFDIFADIFVFYCGHCIYVTEKLKKRKRYYY